MTLTDLLTLSLATWLIAHIIVKLNSPFNIIKALRDKAIARGTEPGSIGEALTCIYCVSVWVGIIVVLVWLSPAREVVYPFAVAGGGLMLWRYTGGEHV